MTFRNIRTTVGICVLLITASILIAQCGERDGRLALSVLFAGEVDQPRSSDWMEFLTEHFTMVDSIDVSRLSMETAADADVVIIDGRFALEENRIYLPKVPPLNRDFTKPVIMVGAAAGATLTRMDLKLDWM